MKIKAVLMINGHDVKSAETWVINKRKYRQREAIEKFLKDFKISCQSETEKYDYKIFLEIGSKMNKDKI